jgi:phosphatidylglycerophosphatase C
VNGVSGTLEIQQFAFFDVDGTVIAQDSFRILMRELILKGSPLRAVLATLLFLFLVPARIFGLAEKTQFKSALLWSATVGLSNKAALTRIRNVVREHVLPLWFREVDDELQSLRAQGLRVCYVSASGEFWLRVLLNAQDRGPKLIIGTKLMRFCGGLALRGKNCLGEEKIRRLRKVIPASAIWQAAYSDHRADLPLLLASRNRTVVNPTPRNLESFQKSLGDGRFTVVHWTPAGSSPESRQTSSSQTPI